jgi:hemerythrin
MTCWKKHRGIAMQWDETLSIGIELIDNQHKEWIQRLNDLSAAIQSGRGATRIAESLDFLARYTELHFGTEERCMIDYKYPELDAHRSKHQELTHTLKNLEEDFDEEGATQSLATAINTFLGNWLVRHIREVDLRFGAFLKERGITISGEA